MNDTCDGMNFTHLTYHLINTATLPWEIQQAKNTCEHNFSF